MRQFTRPSRSAVRLGLEALEARDVPATLLGLTTGNVLLSFDSATPGTTTPIAITGLNGGENVLGVDFRPADGLLYAVTSQNRLLTISATTGAATLVAALTADPADLTNPFTALTGTDFGVDFNPFADRLRVVSDTGQNLRINAANGQVTTDTDLNPGTPNVVAAAYTNNFAGTTGTTLYGLDDAADRLVLQNPPNNGTLATVGTVLGAGIDVTIDSGFDIVTTGGPAARVDTAYATLTSGGFVGLYTIDLTAGTAALVGAVGGGVTPLQGLAVVPQGTVNFQSATFTGSEAGGTAAVVLTRTGGTSGPITVTVTVTGGSATAGTDFTSGPYVVTIPDGATGLTLNVPIVNDALPEGPETFTLALSNASAGVIGALSAATVTVADNDLLQPVAIAAGAATSVPLVATYDSNGTVTRSFTALPGLATGVKVATGDVTGDGIDDLVAVAASGAPVVVVFDGVTGNSVGTFLAYPASLGAASIAVGDLNGDGRADIVVGTATNFGIVYTFSGADFSMMGAALPFGAVLPIGLNVAVGDTDGDGRAEIIVGTASLLAAYAVIDGQSFALRGAYLPFGAISIGLTVAAGDTDGDGRAEIIVGTASSLTAVALIDGVSASLRGAFVAYGSLPVGVNVGSADVDADGRADILTGPTSGSSLLLTFSGTTLNVLDTLLPFGTFSGGIYVG